MEELRSTDVLDKEIRDDARKKAERIFAKADETCKELLSGVEERVAEATKTAENAMKNRLELYKKNVSAALPLEKQRYFVSYIHSSVVEAMNAYFDALDENKKLEVIEKIVERMKPRLENRKVLASVIGFDAKKTQDMLKKSLGSSLTSCTVCDKVPSSEEVIKGFYHNEGVILNAEDNSLTCRITLAEKVKEIMDDKNYELSAALFGGRLPE